MAREKQPRTYGGYKTAEEFMGAIQKAVRKNALERRMQKCPICERHRNVGKEYSIKAGKLKTKEEYINAIREILPKLPDSRGPLIFGFYNGEGLDGSERVEEKDILVRLSAREETPKIEREVKTYYWEDGRRDKLKDVTSHAYQVPFEEFLEDINQKDLAKKVFEIIIRELERFQCGPGL